MEFFLHITEPERLRTPDSRTPDTRQLRTAMVLAADLQSARGMLIAASGHLPLFPSENAKKQNADFGPAFMRDMDGCGGRI